MKVIAVMVSPSAPTVIIEVVYVVVCKIAVAVEPSAALVMLVVVYVVVHEIADATAAAPPAKRLVAS